MRDEEEAYRLVYRFGEALTPGSYFAISHPTWESLPEKGVVQHAEQFYEKIGLAVRLRSRDEIEKFFVGVESVEPGLVYAPSGTRSL